MTVTLTVAPRELRQKTNILRSQGLLPGVVYGTKHQAEPIQIDHKVFTKLFGAVGESTIIQLEGLSEPTEVLVKEVVFDPTAKAGIVHVDLFAIERGKEMTTNVPLHFIGEAPAQKSGGIANKVLHEVVVTCRPSKLPAYIEVSLESLMTVDDRITIADLVVPDGVTIDNDSDEVLAIVGEAKEEPETSEQLDMSAVEVEEKGKSES